MCLQPPPALQLKTPTNPETLDTELIIDIGTLLQREFSLGQNLDLAPRRTCWKKNTSYHGFTLVIQRSSLFSLQLKNCYKNTPISSKKNKHSQRAGAAFLRLRPQWG